MINTEVERIKNYTDSKPKPSSGIQAGGHGGLNSLYFEGDKCLKPAFSSCEREWYEDIAAGKLHPLAAAVAPKFYGIETREVEDPKTQTNRSVDYLILENAAFGFEWFADHFIHVYSSYSFFIVVVVVCVSEALVLLM